MADVAAIDWAGLIVALLAVLGVVGNWIRTSGRTKYLTAIEGMLDTMMDMIVWGQMLMVGMKGGAVDQDAFVKKSTEISDQLKTLKTDLGL